MSVNSHIINSKFIMKQFKISSIDGQVHILDMTNLKLSRKGPGELGTEEGYYDDETEKYLSDLYEGPLSRLLEILINNPDYDLNQDDCNLIGDFLVALYARDPDILPKTYEKTVIAKGLNISINASDLVRTCERTNLRKEFFDDHFPMILINNSSVDFISSVYGCSVTVNVNSGQACWYLPLTPRLAIQFINNSDWEKIFNKVPHGEINEDQAKCVEHFNDQMADYVDLKVNDAIDASHDIYYLFSNREDELKRIKNRIKAERKTKGA